MGNILRRRKLPSEELDELVLQIKELEVQLKELLTGKAWTLKWLLYSIFLVVGSSSAYYWLQSCHFKRKLFIISALLSCGSLAFVALRLLIISGYDWSINRKQKRIKEFTDRKMAIIEEVKENEKFKVAKEIIEKYASEAELNELLGTSIVAMDGALKKEEKVKNASGENASNQDAGMRLSRRQSLSPMPKLYEIPEMGRSHSVHNYRTPIRPFVEQSRTPVDRILDYVMGESINNRYALICSNCRVHNGMALKEEFEQISFFCFKCNFFNPPKSELSTRCGSLFDSRTNPNYFGHTDDSTENENEDGLGRKLSAVSTSTETSQQEDEATREQE